MDRAVTITNISKTFHSGKDAVKALVSVNIEIQKGEIFGLLGPNGAGKTTLISIMSGLISPESGTIIILGYDCSKQITDIKKHLNVVSGFTGVLNSLTCEQSLTYYGLLYNVPNLKTRINDVLKLTNLTPVRNQLAEELSSGMKQRFMLAKALLNEPDILILDEPTVGLDVESALSIRHLIKQLRSEGRTILLTTHNMFEAEELCDRIAFINRGKIMEIGTPTELKRHVVSNRLVEIHCSEDECVVKTLSKIKGVSASVKSANLVHVSVDSYKKMKEIMKALANCDSEIYSINEMEPTLEETYLKIINKKGKQNE
ncbi:Trehalose/maltose import ATP-binding protein MalK [Candidatus Bilamarchaeum dharawalense]|uniref:Trehalose/maltose import ATP-binding protein MalK n=1 Tax=Candidatus Bilamarchaeum dharawalense TaxID=2885759 RepID=A0A5E4LS33_9ARCH|nr:Trehalose/maltose import ATP-binding protein MalK [Candidatus Bilamarchaeum dharawalense]